MIAYVTDIEGRWDKLAAFVADNPHVSLVGDRLRLADGVTFVFGGDAIDRGPAGHKLVDLLLAAKRDYGDRVVLLAGNRDINKLRLVVELAGEPPRGAPTTATRGELLRWIFANTMGAPQAFAHRATELATTDDDAVVDSFLADLAPGGPLRAYLAACRLGVRLGETLFLHGGATAENLGVVPGTDARAPTVDAWLAGLDRFYRDQIAVFEHGGRPVELIAYQAPTPGTHENQASVVYARPTDDIANPHLPPIDVVARLRADGVGRLVVGHTPSGDSPAILRDGDFEMVLADNSYGRVEVGSQLAFTDAETTVRGTAELDDGARVAIAFATARARTGSPLGLRDRATNQLVKSQLGDGYLLFRGLPQRRVSQVAALEPEVAARDLAVARDAS